MKKITVKPISKRLEKRIQKALAEFFAPKYSRSSLVIEICDKLLGDTREECLCDEIETVVENSKFKILITKKR